MANQEEVVLYCPIDGAKCVGQFCVYRMEKTCAMATKNIWQNTLSASANDSVLTGEQLEKAKKALEEYDASGMMTKKFTSKPIREEIIYVDD